MKGVMKCAVLNLTVLRTLDHLGTLFWHTQKARRESGDISIR